MDSAPIHGYTLHYKPEFGDWETVEVAVDAQKYTIENLFCGSRFQVYATGYNRYDTSFFFSLSVENLIYFSLKFQYFLYSNSIGAGEASDILNTRTKGSKPIMPENSKFIEPSSNSVTLHLPTWKDGSCRMSHFVVEYKKKYIHFCTIANLNCQFTHTHVILF